METTIYFIIAIGGAILYGILFTIFLLNNVVSEPGLGFATCILLSAFWPITIPISFIRHQIGKRKLKSALTAQANLLKKNSTKEKNDPWMPKI